MIKLKDIINEKKQLNEKKEIAPKPIQAIGVLTQRNQHNVARAMVAKGMLNNKKLYDAYMKIDDLADFFGSLPPELSQLRNKMDEKYLARASWERSLQIQPDNNDSRGWLILSAQDS